MKFARTLALLGVLAFVAAAAVVPSHARAGLLGDLFAKKQQIVSLADIYPVQTEEDFQNVAKAIHGTPYNDPQLEFEILVPKDWDYEETAQVHDASGPNRELVGDIARFKSPIINTMQATVTVQSVKLDNEISAENWLKNYILSNNYDLQDAVVPVGEKKASASCITVTEGRSSYAYIGVQINGNNAMIVRFETPLPLKDAVGFVRKRVVDSFRFILETDRPIEVQKSFSFGDALKFRYPESLSMDNVDVRDSRHMSMLLYNKRRQGLVNQNVKNPVSQVLGLMRFDVVRRGSGTSLKKETAEIKNFVENTLGLEFKKLVSFDKPPVSNRFMFARYEIYQVSSKKGNALDEELRFVALGDKNWYVFATLLTPSDNENFYAWAVNIEDFGMIVKDFR